MSRPSSSATAPTDRSDAQTDCASSAALDVAAGTSEPTADGAALRANQADGATGAGTGSPGSDSDAYEPSPASIDAAAGPSATLPPRPAGGLPGAAPDSGYLGDSSSTSDGEDGSTDTADSDATIPGNGSGRLPSPTAAPTAAPRRGPAAAGSQKSH